MSAPAIVVDGVTKHFRRPQEQMHTFKERALHPFRGRHFDQFTAVDDVSLVVEEGEFFGIVGRNGSGKSTLLKLIAGIYQTSAGEIWTRGRMSTFIELGVGFNPDLAARDNVILNGIMLGLTAADARDRYEQVIDFAELREYDTSSSRTTRRGMHVRLAFSVMIQVDADLLLIDEVLAVGDAAFQQKCFDQFNRMRDEDKTIILVTHDMGAVRRFCDRAMLMERGAIVREGEPTWSASTTSTSTSARTRRRRTPRRSPSASASATGRPATTAVDRERRRAAADPRAAGRGPRPHATSSSARDRDPVVSLISRTPSTIRCSRPARCGSASAPASFKAGERGYLACSSRPPRPRPLLRVAVGRARAAPATVLDRFPRMVSFLVTGTREPGGMVQLDHDFSFARSRSRSPPEHDDRRRAAIERSAPPAAGG